jgi:ubiquitin C-terminal hydrolase
VPDGDSEKQEILMKTISSDDTIDKYNYELVGVLIHSGSANSGHYFSYIKERNRKSVNFGKWFEFNDKTVKRFDIGNLGRESFGG